MGRDKFKAVNQCIREASQQAAADGGLSVPPIERFLRTGEETWDGAGSGSFTPDQYKQDEAYRRAARTALLTLFRLLANLLTAEAKLVPQVSPKPIRRRVEPMVKGLVQRDWQEGALRELTHRPFVLK